MNKKWVKQIITVLLAIAILLSDNMLTLAGGVPAASTKEEIDAVSEDFITSGNYQYKIQTVGGVNYAYLNRYTGTESNIIIQNKIDGYIVRGILMTSLLLDNYTARTITLPDTISSIGAGAFLSAYALESISINKSSSAGFHTVDGVLYNWTQLTAYPAAKAGTHYSILDGTTEIQAYAFYGCSNLTKITVPASTNVMCYGSFSHSMKPVDIVLKRDSFYSNDYADGACWQMALGTKIVVKTEQLKNQLLLGMKNKEGYKDSTKTMDVDTYSVKATGLTFKDGKTEKNISISMRAPADGYPLYSLYTQAPADTTENVTWKVTSGSDICSVSQDSQLLYTKSGGTATLEGKDETGHTLRLNVTVTSPINKFELEGYSTDIQEGGIGTSIHADIQPRTSFAYTNGVTWKSSDTSIATVEGSVANSCNVTGVSVGVATITATISDNGKLISKSVNITVSGEMSSCTVDPIPTQTYYGTQLTPKPIVRYRGRILTEGTDYILTYGQNSFAGQNVGCVYINGRNTTFSNNYTLVANFSIVDGTGKTETPPVTPPVTPPASTPQNPPPPVYNPPVKEETTSKPKPKVSVSKTSVRSVKSKKKGTLEVTWKKNSKVTGYQVQYSTDSKFKKYNKTVKVKKYKTTSCSIKKLKSRKNYHVRIRSYKTVKGKTYYSSWSNTKKIKVK